MTVHIFLIKTGLPIRMVTKMFSDMTKTVNSDHKSEMTTKREQHGTVVSFSASASQNSIEPVVKMWWRSDAHSPKA